MAEIKIEADADIPALIARCRHQGKNTSEANLLDAKRPWHGCEAGNAMARQAADDETRAVLWEAIKHMRAAFSAYDAAMGAPSRHAQCLRIMVPPAAMQTDASAPAPDPRDEATRHQDAIKGMITLEAWLKACPHGHEAKLVVIDNQRCRNPAGLVETLHAVAKRMIGAR